MRIKTIFCIIVFDILLMGAATSSWALIEGGGDKLAFTRDFRIGECTFSPTGENPFFVLEPGFKLVLEGEEGKELVHLEITVLDETESVGSIQTRVVEERESKDGRLVEVSRNFFAICQETNSVFYFGEDVFICDAGLEGDLPFNCPDGPVSHDGEWRAFELAEDGESFNMPGIIMPGTILLGSRYFQEIAPDVAMDRAEIVGMDETVESPTLPPFVGCLKTKETTPLEPNSKGFKFYAPGIGLVKDGELVLIEYNIPGP
jgi:hypothetical protein